MCRRIDTTQISEYALTMGRNQTYDTSDIVHGAREIFLEQGPNAPTATIAKHLGVSEGLLFKRFGTKENLFLAAMGIRDFDATLLIEKCLLREDMSQNLSELATEILKFLREMFPSMMMLWLKQKDKSRGGLPQKLKSPMVQMINAIADYLEQEMQRGRLAKVDPLVAARMIVATAANYVLFETVGRRQPMPLDSDIYVKKLIDILWFGLNPASSVVTRDGER